MSTAFESATPRQVYVMARGLVGTPVRMYGHDGTTIDGIIEDSRWRRWRSQQPGLRIRPLDYSRLIVLVPFKEVKRLVLNI